MKCLRITPRNRHQYQERIAALEERSEYPLGEDSFKISHGADYFAFFDRLGEVRYYVVLEGECVIAVAAGILRKIPFAEGLSVQRTWYLCDLKIHPDYRGRHIPTRLLSYAFLPGYFKCQRGYAISMNPAGGQPNRVVKILSRFRWAPGSLAATLNIYSLDQESVHRYSPIIERYRGPICFLSLKGKKDLILKSTGQSMPLLHMQFGNSELGQVFEPQEGFQHMFCAPSGDSLALSLQKAQLFPTATASIIHYRMNHSNWNFIRTSDI